MRAPLQQIRAALSQNDVATKNECKKDSQTIEHLNRTFLGHQGPRRRDIHDPNPGPLSVAFDKEWPGRPGFGCEVVALSQVTPSVKNFSQVLQTL